MRTVIFLTLCVVSHLAFGQDERFYRDIFNGNLLEGVKPLHYKIEVASSKYMIDLNSDGIKDSFQTIKRDGIDFIRINDAYGKVMLERELLTKGGKSKIFKAHLKNVNKDTNVLILHFYEGQNESSIFEGSARLYFITFPKNNLAEATLTKGPYFWTENERAAGKYFNRRYSVNVIDYNDDGTNEISVSFNSSQRMYLYKLNGKWVQL